MSKLQSAIEHMNNDHVESLRNLVKHHKGVDAQNPRVVDMTYESMKVAYEGGELELKFSFKADDDTLHMAVVELCQKAKPAEKDLDKQISEYKKGFKSVIIASVAADGQAISSYAPVIFDGDDMYVFMSEVAEHYHALVANPQRAEVMFLQDESMAKTVFARVRLRYKVSASVIERGAEFDRLFELMKQQQSGEKVDMFYKMQDFHFVKLSARGGRFVKGFGAAYDIDENGKAKQARVERPHKMG